MGKSPAKWIKTVLFGKKASRSNISKGGHASKATTEKETWIAAKEPTTDLPVDPPSVSEPNTGTNYSKEEDLLVEEASASSYPRDVGETPEVHDADKLENVTTSAPDDPERIRREQAAIKAQAAFRGYLARRAFWALKGIIRLQALVRGHLVRRQAIATLHCLQGIIKFQVLVRDRNAAGSDGLKKGSLRGNLEATRSGSFDRSVTVIKLSGNVFVRKLLKSSTNTLPLRVPYGLEEPNSAWNWLERWSRLSETVAPVKKVTDSEDQLTQKKVTDSEDQLTQKKVTDSEDQLTQNQGLSKRTKRRLTATVVENDTIHSTSESEKPKRQLRKTGNQLADPNRDHPQNELEKVKRSLRKVSNSVIEPNSQLDVEREKPTVTLRKASNNQASDIPDSTTFVSAEKLNKSIAVENKNIAVEMEKLSTSPRKSLNSPSPDIPDISICDTTENSAFSEPKEHANISSSVPFASERAVDVLHKDLPPSDLQPSENITKDESIIVPNAVSITKESQTKHHNQKTTKRRASFPAKLESPDNELQNTPSPVLPSYMAATKSAKAKLRGLESPRVADDVVENNSFTRRHSLSAPKNGKLTSVSPRTQKIVQANGKGGNKNEKSLHSSRDGSGWRR